MKKTNLLFLGITLGMALLLAILFVPVFSAVTITQGETGERLFVAPVESGDTFIIRYIHSIHLTPVEEMYRIDEEGKMILDETRFQSYGVGIPYELEEGQTFSFEGDWMVISNINRVVPYFDQRVGQVIANHTLIMKDKKIPLSNISKPGSWVRFQIEKVSLFSIWRERGLPE
ncbi:DUF1850 domain-containing protein [Microaerobacter geothermalis]|nr:DUF1850 domain-containing protein [Microaerobacter geothermalis]